MSGTAFTCPECGANARSAREIATGALVKCPTCSHVFRFGEEAAPAARRPEPAADEPRPRRRDDDYDDDRPRRRRYDDEDDRRIRSRRDADYDNRPRPRRRDDDDYDDRPRRRKGGRSLTSMVFVVVFLLMIVGIAGGVLAYAYKSTGSNEVVQRPVLPPPQARGGTGFVGEGGFGGNFETTGLNNSEEPGEDKGKLTTGAAALMTNAPRVSDRPRQLSGPPPSAPKESAKGNDMPPEILEKAKKATTMIVFRNGPIGGSGTGFFVGPDLVMTNAHVVGMLAPGTQKPQRLDIYLNSGLPNEAKCTGTVMDVDREHDLALVKVGKPDKKDVKFPEPLPIAASSTLKETQQLWVFGFPHGDQLGKRITIAPARVSSFRTTASGTRVQVHGGMEHGNSGGPVVDVAGQVVGVSVAKIENTEINFAVATEHVTDLLRGHLATLTAGSPTRKKSDFALDVSIKGHDPLKKIGSVAIEWWWGKADEKNPASRGKPGPASPGRQKVALKRDGDKFTGEVVLGPSLQKDRVVWLQAVYADGADEVRYEGIAVEVFTEADAKPVTFAYHPRKAEGLVGVRSTGTYQFATRTGGVHTMEIDVAAVLREERLGKGDGSWVFRDHFKDFRGNILQDGSTMDRSLDVLDNDKHIKKSTLELQTDERGKVTAGRPIIPNDASEESKRMLSHFAGQLARGIELASVDLPGGQIEPGHTWKDQRHRELGEPGGDSKITINFEYKYVGVRTMDGREVAELAVSGEVGNQWNETDGTINGKARGTVFVDVKTGVVSRANLGIDVDQKSGHFQLGDAEVHCTLEISLQRE